MIDKIIAHDSSGQHLPPGWRQWSTAVDEGHPPADLNFACQQAALNRFAARFRVAKAFRGVILDSYSSETTLGYSGLFRLFLTWTAFEQYLKVIPNKQSQCLSWFRSYVPSDAVTRIRVWDDQNRFYNLIISKARPDVESELARYLRGEDFNFTYLASSVRHIFAHGLLTPNAKGAVPEAVSEICNLLADIHLNAMSGDFQRRVVEFLQSKSYQ